MKEAKGKPAKKLMEIAILQMGYFTAAQAVECGIPSHHHDRYIGRGEWDRQRRGIFHLKGVPVNSLAEAWVLALWFRNRAGEQIGYFSHETALAIFGLGEFTFDHIHITVPKTFRKSADVPADVTVHKADLAEQELMGYEGLPVTSPLQSIISLLFQNRVDDVLIKRAFLDAKREGYVSEKQIRNWPNLNSKILEKLTTWVKNNEK